jgi:hypothetical protein
MPQVVTKSMARIPRKASPCSTEFVSEAKIGMHAVDRNAARQEGNADIVERSDAT